MTPNSTPPRVLVVGDLMVDRYLWGSCQRVSPEAPVPVIDVEKTTHSLGGAGNVLRNLISLGATADICSVVGRDHNTDLVRGLLTECGIAGDGLVVDDRRPITEKTRVIAAHQQVVRHDIETRQPIDGAHEQRLLDYVRAARDNTDVIIVSDYGKGVLSSDFTRRLITWCRDAGIPVFCDPKGPDYTKYAGANLLTPNRREAGEAAGIPIADPDSLDRCGRALLDSLALEYCLITLSGDGMALFHRDGFDRLPTVAREVFDVTGAGDTVIASMAFAYARDRDMLAACRFANTAAGIVVGKLGAATVTPDEITRFQAAATDTASKILPAETARALAASHRLAGRRVVFTNGCFDLLHAGHVEYLEAAARLGDVLVVGLNTDASVARLKGPDRPITPEADRARVLSALACIDYVVLFDQDTPLELISTILPDVLVKGGDYAPDEIVGADVVRSRGGLVTTIPLSPGRSTSATIERILEVER